MSLLLKPKLVIFEGSDKVGKTKQFRGYRSVTHFGPLAIDRFTGSNWVYDQFYNRKTDLKSYLISEEKIQEAYDCYLILLTAPSRVILQRILDEEHGNDKDLALENYAKARDLFQEYFDQFTRFEKKLIVNTGYHSPQDTLNEILKFTGEKLI